MTKNVYTGESTLFDSELFPSIRKEALGFGHATVIVSWSIYTL
jgi:hypothetical protein